MSNVIGMGELLVEHVSTAKNVSRVHSPGFIKAFGGAPANVAVALQRLGLRAGFLGKVGNDPFGEYLRQSPAQAGVDTSYLFVDQKARTTAVYVAVWDDGRKDLCFYLRPGAEMMLNTGEFNEGVSLFLPPQVNRSILKWPKSSVPAMIVKRRTKIG
jgi:fructokinase